MKIQVSKIINIAQLENVRGGRMWKLLKLL